MYELISLFCSFFLLFSGRLSVTFDTQIDLELRILNLYFEASLEP